MKDDAVTESISHFIGFFALAEEEARLRVEYDRFRSKKALEEEQERLEAESQARTAPMSPEGYDPDLNYKPTPELPVLPARAQSEAPPADLTDPSATAPQLAELPLQLPAGIGSSIGSINYVLPPPSSMAAVIIQKNTLTDDDVIGVSVEIGQAAAAKSFAGMTALQELAEALSPITVTLQDIDGDWTEIVPSIVQSAEALAETVSNLEGAQTETAETGEVTITANISGAALEMTFATGEAALGNHVDGVAVEEMPEWQDYLPDFLKEESEDEEGEADQAAATDDAPEDGAAENEDGAEAEAAPAQTADEAPATETVTETATAVSQDGEGTVDAGEPAPAKNSKAEIATEDDAETAALSQEAAPAEDGSAAAASEEGPATEGVAVQGEGVSGLEIAADEGEEGPAPEDLEHDFSEDFEDGSPGADVEFDPGHHVTTGANQLVNETTVHSTWLDGKVIVSGGNYVKLDAISQTNVIIECDSAPGSVATAIGGIGEPGPDASEGHNFAQIETISREDYEKEKEEEAAAKAAEEAAAETGEGAVEEGDDLAAADDTAAETTENETAEETEALANVYPSDWAVTTIDGDLIQINWSEQVNFVSDADTISFSFTASNTTVGTGENLTVNDFFAWELGFQYDLVIVGGDIIDATVVKQMNVLLDSDTLEVTLLQDDLEEDACEEDACEEHVPVGQTGAEAAHVVADEPCAPAAAAEEGIAAGIKASMADNMLMNQAKIVTIGEDVVAEMDQTYSDILDGFKEGSESALSSILGAKEFAGETLLKVLHIKQDFKTVNVVKQTNVLGDDDKVELAIDEFAAGLKEDMEVTMGSNALANLALVKDSGVDSTVMATGEVYSDALLHQAELVAPEMPDMSQMAAMKDALATEAVAFLADEMVAKQETMQTMKDDMIASMDISPPSIDIMQTMLT